MSSADIRIVGGTIVDGTGAPGRAGTVVVEGDRLRVLAAGDAAGGAAASPDQAARTIDDVELPALLALVWTTTKSPALRELLHHAREAFADPNASNR